MYVVCVFISVLGEAKSADLYTGNQTPLDRITTYVKTYIGDKIQNKEMMESLTEEGEILEVINKFKICKVPGIDGLNAEYYQAFKNMLIPKLKKKN